MKVYVVISLWESEEGNQLETEIFANKEKARACMQEWVDNLHHFIEDIQRDIDDGNNDSMIENELDYFYAHDSVNFETLTIYIEEKEIK